MTANPKCLVDTRSGSDSQAIQIALVPGLAEALRAQMTKSEKFRQKFDWSFHARENQILPINLFWAVWLVCAGRGWGKSRAGAEAVRWAIERLGCRRVALVARTASDARDVMVEGESGLLAICPPGKRPKYERSKRRLTWPNGAIATLYSADNPDLLRGPQHDFAWCDELAAWRYVEESWDNLVMGLRLTSGPCRIVVTTTPRVISFLRDLMDRPDTLLTNGSTYENLTNLNEVVKSNLLRYKGSDKEEQELLGILRGSVAGALLKTDTLEQNRVLHRDAQKKIWKRVVMGCDPSTTQSKDSDDYGIVVSALGADGHTYTIGDHTVDSTKHGPEKAAEEIVKWSIHYGVTEIVVETNAGGDLVLLMIKNAFREKAPRFQIPKITPLRSTEGKSERAEVAQILVNVGMAHMVGQFSELENELTTWIPGKSRKSPNRIDAWVFSVNGLNPTLPPAAAQIAGANTATDYSKILTPKRVGSGGLGRFLKG